MPYKLVCRLSAHTSPSSTQTFLLCWLSSCPESWWKKWKTKHEGVLQFWTLACLWMSPGPRPCEKGINAGHSFINFMFCSFVYACFSIPLQRKIVKGGLQALSKGFKPSVGVEEVNTETEMKNQAIEDKQQISRKAVLPWKLQEVTPVINEMVNPHLLWPLEMTWNL